MQACRRTRGIVPIALAMALGRELTVGPRRDREQPTMKGSRYRKLISASALLLVFSSAARLRSATPQGTQAASQQSSGSVGEVTVPQRPSEPLFKGQQGKQGSEIEFAPSSRVVTIKLQVQDPSGYFLPNLRRENFAVYENGVRQKNVTVEIERAPVTVAMLIELGGRYHELNKELEKEVRDFSREMLDVVGRDDKIAVYKYDAKLEALSDFKQGHEALDSVFDHLAVPGSSETNFYDALLETLSRVREVSGRKAVIVLSTGVDTFSKATFEQTLEAVRESNTPIYAIGLAAFAQSEASLYGPEAPFARIDWNGAEGRLEQLARASGGRAYEPKTYLEIPAIYDDIMENLRVRYVVTYVSSNTATTGPPRKVRVDLIDPATGAPLTVRDSSGKTIAPKIFVQESYTPGASSGG